MTFSSAVNWGNKLNCWKTMPASRRSSRTVGPLPSTLRPLTTMSPPSMVSSALMQRRKVDLPDPDGRSEEHTSELQSLMRISYAVFCLKKKTNKQKVQKSKIYREQHGTKHKKIAITCILIYDI